MLPVNTEQCAGFSFQRQRRMGIARNIAPSPGCPGLPLILPARQYRQDLKQKIPQPCDRDSSDNALQDVWGWRQTWVEKCSDCIRFTKPIIHLYCGFR